MVLRFLRRQTDYLGAIGIDPQNRIHWALYRQKLILSYRYVDSEIRIFYAKFEEHENFDVKDIGTAAALKGCGFRVIFEDSGLRQTIFDPYQSFEHSKRAALLERYLSGHLASIADEIMLRIGASDPRLKDTLYSALQAFERIETTDDIAQVALSCRRFFEGLANMLYPPQDGLVGGRRVTATEYRNRLWAYVEERLGGAEQRLALAQLDDVGRRIDSIDGLSNKGVHDRVSRLHIHRLVVALLALTYDLLSLTPPPLEAPTEPYVGSLHQIARDLIAEHPKSTD